MKAIRTILFPTDFSESSMQAWDHALLHAKKHKAKIVLLHVVQLMPSDYQFLAVAMTPGRILAALRATADEKMTLMVRSAKRAHVACRMEMRDGMPFVQIIRCAKKVKADMIVMGSHGRTGLAQALIGSVAEKVVHKAPCSVLVIKHPSRKFRMP